MNYIHYLPLKSRWDLKLVCFNNRNKKTNQLINNRFNFKQGNKVKWSNKDTLLWVKSNSTRWRHITVELPSSFARGCIILFNSCFSCLFNCSSWCTVLAISVASSFNRAHCLSSNCNRLRDEHSVWRKRESSSSA